MQREIHIRNLNSTKYRSLTIAGVILLVISIATWLLQGPDYIAYVAAALGVAAFTVLSMDSFTTANAVSYGKESITMKLLGNKTIGFLFSDVQEIRLLEQGLLIRLQDREDVKLSRKRYSTKSLEQLETILKEKTRL